jgi:hypothetical protein
VTTDHEKERELDRSVLLGISYVGSRPATFRDAANNLTRLGHWLMSLFGRAASRPPQDKKPGKVTGP